MMRNIRLRQWIMNYNLVNAFEKARKKSLKSFMRAACKEFGTKDTNR